MHYALIREYDGPPVMAFRWYVVGPKPNENGIASATDPGERYSESRVRI